MNFFLNCRHLLLYASFLCRKSVCRHWNALHQALHCEDLIRIRQILSEFSLQCEPSNLPDEQTQWLGYSRTASLRNLLGRCSTAQWASQAKSQALQMKFFINWRPIKLNLRLRININYGLSKKTTNSTFGWTNCVESIKLIQFDWSSSLFDPSSMDEEMETILRSSDFKLNFESTCT